MFHVCEDGIQVPDPPSLRWITVSNLRLSIDENHGQHTIFHCVLNQGHRSILITCGQERHDFGMKFIHG